MKGLAKLVASVGCILGVVVLAGCEGSQDNPGSPEASSITALPPGCAQAVNVKGQFEQVAEPQFAAKPGSSTTNVRVRWTRKDGKQFAAIKINQQYESGRLFVTAIVPDDARLVGDAELILADAQFNWIEQSHSFHRFAGEHGPDGSGLTEVDMPKGTYYLLMHDTGNTQGASFDVELTTAEPTPKSDPNAGEAPPTDG
jgi:hypothetical protein